MARVTLTTQLVKTIDCPKGKKKTELFDILSRGLSLEVRATGGKTYYRRYRDSRGRIRQIKLGNERDLSLADARLLADKVGRQVAMGEDPFAKKRALKAVPTLAVFINESYLPYVQTYKRSWATDKSLIKNHIMPNFGSFYMDELAKKDIISFINQHLLTHKPGSVNRVIILLRYIYNLSIRWETDGILKNPTAGIPLLEENNKKERFLTSDEAHQLISELKKSESPMLQYIVPMLILTGARKNEVLQAQWQDFNLITSVWRIPISKSGKARHVPISDGVRLLLSTIPRVDDCPWTFANPKTGKPLVSFFSSWNKVRKAVGLADVRIHDLSHTFASFLVNNGRSIYEVQRILGHTQIKTTERYAHLSQDSLLAAANEISKAVPIFMTALPHLDEIVTVK